MTDPFHNLQKSPTSKPIGDYHRSQGHRNGGSIDILGSSKSNPPPPPEHLSEFYSLVNKIPLASPSTLSPTHSNISITKPSPAFSNSSSNQVKRQPSLNTFTSFSPSVLDLPDIVTSKDFQTSIETYENVIQKAAKLRQVLQTVSEVANEFGEALEDCINKNPKINNPKLVHDGLINAAGLQYMMGSNQQILSRLIESSYEVPLRDELNKLKQHYKLNHSYYQTEIKLKSKLLRTQELENLKLSKQKTRNLNIYKHNLLNLTNQLDEIDRLKYDYYHEINSIVTKFNQDHLLIKTGSLIRAQLEISEGIARKGWSGGGLDDLLSISPDLFEVNYKDDEDMDEQKQNEEHDVIDDDNGDGLDDEELIDDDTLETVKFTHTNNNNNNNNNFQPLSHPEPIHTKNIAISTTTTTENVLSKLLISTPTPTPQEGNSKQNAAGVLTKLNDNSMDESFSLPMVNNTIGSSKNKLIKVDQEEEEQNEEDDDNDDDEGIERDAIINKDNILDDLQNDS
ncbi:hypothetical protein DFJ63DRAFT_313817 [Scheffersomyces coipomensis]|uniref:uncharacterized protein n=1 Tax=Scheffersomyces coipomensis TaxID=1788519 RepID=UPI00315D942D